MDHQVELITPDDLSEAEKEACKQLVVEGGEIEVGQEGNVLTAKSIVLIRFENSICALGAIKRLRVDRASEVALKAKHHFDPTVDEAGYIVVGETFRGHGRGQAIVRALIGISNGNLWATSRTAEMKSILLHAGFQKSGIEWLGNPTKAPLSLWILQSG